MALFIPSGWKAEGTQNIERETSLENYARIHQYDDKSTICGDFHWQVVREGVYRVSGIVETQAEAIDNCNLYLDGYIELIIAKFHQDKLDRLNKNLADANEIYLELQAVGISAPTIYEQAYKSGYLAGVIDENKAMLAMMASREPVQC